MCSCFPFLVMARNKRNKLQGGVRQCSQHPDIRCLGISQCLQAVTRRQCLQAVTRRQLSTSCYKEAIVYKLLQGGNCRTSNLPISPSPAIDGENLNSSIFGLLFVPSLVDRSVGRSVVRLAGKACPTDSIFMTRPDQTRLFHRREYPVDSR